MKQFYEVCVYTSLVMCGQEGLHIYKNIDVCICVCPFVCLSLPLSLSSSPLSHVGARGARGPFIYAQARILNAVLHI